VLSPSTTLRTGRGRQRVYEAARARNPRRWSRGVRQWNDPEHVWLNPPPKIALMEKAVA
jgi:putative transposase